MMSRDKIRRLFYILLPLLGFGFCMSYIWRTGLNVVYTDYIRITDYYLPDVFDIHKFLVPDILTRIPINYLERMVNVVFFGFDTRFDMVMGALFLLISAWVIGYYCYKRNLNGICFLVISVVMFSLNKWEMLINGTGWVHFMAFACFFYHYLVADRMLIKKTPKKWDDLRLKILPFVIVLGVAGPYCASPCVTLMLLYIWAAWSEHRETGRWNRSYGIYLLCNLAPMLLYLVSSAFVDEPPVGVATGFILPYIINDPVFFIKFFIKSFGSMVIGEETAQYLGMTGTQVAALGLLLIFFYLTALWLYWKEKIYEVSWFPLILMVSGGFNHILVLISRWRFMKDTYGMSSRYALQFQVGIIGILLTFGLAFLHWKNWQVIKRCVLTALSAIVAATLLTGSYITTDSELFRSKYKREYFEGLREMAFHPEDFTDEELGQRFQYSRYPEKIRKALELLEENRLNVFYEKRASE